MPHDWRAFVEAQNDGYQTGPENDSGGRDPTGSQEDGLAHTDCAEIVHELARPSKKVWR